MKSVNLIIFGKEYFLNFPNNGEMIDIQKMKMALAEGMYGEMVRSATTQDLHTLDMIDALATFHVLIPELKTDKKITSYRTLDQFTTKEIVKVYKKQYFPWFKELFDELQKFDEDEEKKADNA